MAATIEGEDRVLATAQHIVKSLRTSKDVTDDMLLILSTFDNRLSNISDLVNNNGASSAGRTLGSAQLDSDPLLLRFESAERMILQYDSESGNRCYIWEDSSTADECCEYLAAVDEILVLMEEPRFQENAEAMDRAESTVQMAMAKLEDEFHNLLGKNTVPLDAEKLYGSIHRVSLSFAENEDEEEVIEGFESFGVEEDGRKRCYHERGGSLVGGDNISVEIVNPEVISDLREMSERMIRAGYEKECCQVYSSVRRDVLDEYLGILGVEKLSIEELQKVEWTALDEKMKKWVQAVKIVVKVLLKGEKRLCEQIFDGSELIKQVCFVEIAKGCVMQLLNFGEAVAIGKRSSEKLFRILDMYDALAAALPVLQGLFMEDAGGFVCNEARGVLYELGGAAKGTLIEFEKAVKTESSKKPIHGADIHPLARYVMNYARLLVDYSHTLNSLLEADLYGDANEAQKDEEDDQKEISALGSRLVSLIGSLESNLEDKAKLYEDVAMQYIFLMNNKLYIVQKVKDSELAKLLGDDWLRRRRGLIRKYATSYLRASWTKVLSFLKDDGIGGSSSSASKVALKEKFKSFNACFEDIYRVQTAWKVPDSQLRTELRISVSEKVVPAYRSFLGRFGSQLDGGRHAGKYIKYTTEDIEGYLADLFEGTPTIIHHVRRKTA